MLGGAISGPYLNGTVLSGLATPSVYEEGKLQAPIINLYGVLDDEYPFYLHEYGVGSPTAQITRLVCI